MDPKMKILSTPLSGLNIVETNGYFDKRGAFQRFYCDKTLISLIGKREIVQINHSLTVEVGTIRGMHFQNHPHAEMKLIRCIRGRVWDVAVDIRKNSYTFLKWYAEELTPLNSRMMVIPEGFAHGFQVLEPNSELLYFHTARYEPESEGGIRFDDPLLGIRWPLNAVNLAIRDKRHSLIQPLFEGVEF